MTDFPAATSQETVLEEAADVFFDIVRFFS